ncbi:hypothetical protein LPJ61_005621 [Coemansia biformis]|uniref:Gti1/Pac2 family-domain-containing protein n=1 Tax=Coemansia biformis TaxID=1286918 RepID=A0A9W7Y666_9FUNG|nr:hypothetical protein LPJ61_005621 [Coemansia biformis]
MSMEPTYRGYIATTDDALLMFEACRLGVLQRRKRRLSEGERRAIAPGCVFVWDETESGIRRWTDGKRWSPSRVNGCFLVYSELEPRGSEQQQQSMASAHLGMPQVALSDPPPGSGLTKKTLSLFTTQSSKLHLVCYYRKDDAKAARLTTPSQDPYLRGITIPRSLYPDILPEMTQPIGFRAHPAARRRRLSGAPVTILVRGCTSLQPTQHSDSPSYPQSPQPFASYQRHGMGTAQPPLAGALQPPPPLAGVPALAGRRRNSTATNYLTTAMYRHRASVARSAQAPAMLSPIAGPHSAAVSPVAAREQPPTMPPQPPTAAASQHYAHGAYAHGPPPPPYQNAGVPYVSVPAANAYGSSAISSPAAYAGSGAPTPCRSSHGWASESTTRRSSTLVGSDAAHAAYAAASAHAANNPTSSSDGGGSSNDGRVQLPPISELIKSIDRPQPPSFLQPPAACEDVPPAHKLSPQISHVGIQRWHSHSLATAAGAQY